LEQAIREAVPQWSLAEVVTALQAMRGIDLIAAVAVFAKIGDLSRFQNPRELMWLSGPRSLRELHGRPVKRGGISKAGNGRAATHPSRGGVELSVPCARGTGEAAKGRGRVEARARDRVERTNTFVRSLPCAPAQRQAADDRVTAIARELSAFIWVINREGMGN